MFQHRRSSAQYLILVWKRLFSHQFNACRILARKIVWVLVPGINQSPCPSVLSVTHGFISNLLRMLPKAHFQFADLLLLFLSQDVLRLMIVNALQTPNVYGIPKQVRDLCLPATNALRKRSFVGITRHQWFQDTDREFVWMLL